MNLESLKDRACRLPVAGVLVRAFFKSRQDFNKDISAGIAYFSFLSIFPLLLAVVAVGSRFLDSDSVRGYIDKFISETLPASAGFVTDNIDALIHHRGAVTFASVAILFWSASKMVAAMTRAVNYALKLKRTYSFFLSPLRNFGMTVMVSLLLFVVMALSPVAEILTDFNLEFLGEDIQSLINVAAGKLTSLAITFLVMSSIYLLLPYKRPHWSALLPGAIVAALLIELGKSAFLLYIGNASRFEAVYGSLTSIIVLLIWLYYSARILLYGSEVIAVIEGDNNRERETQ